MIKKPKSLPYHSLKKTLDVSELNFKTTKELSLLTGALGQNRALQALKFGIGIKSHGYNLFAMGPSGIGKHSLVNNYLAKHAPLLKTPPDWCYIHNFTEPDQPIAISLPAGMGKKFQLDMKILIDKLSTNIITVFESDKYRSKLKKIKKHFVTKRKNNLQNNPQTVLEKTPLLYKKQHEKENAFQAKAVSTIVKPYFSRLKKKYAKFPLILTYLNAAQVDIVENVNDFVKQDEQTNLHSFSLENPALTRYKVNVLVDNSETKGAPIIYEEVASYASLICRIEHTTQDGSLVTNFTLIRPGALHRANGGYLLLEARKLRKNRDAWEALKIALHSQEIRVKPVDNITEAAHPVSLEPAPIPLNTKIILLGERHIYYTMCQHDADFSALFKVALDFDEQIDRNKKNVLRYARLISTIINRKKMRHFTAAAVSTIIEHSSRLAEDIEKLSMYTRDIDDLLSEADYWASLKNKRLVDAGDVKRAISAKVHREDRTRELYYEDILRNFIIIYTAGKLVGQLNCLSVRLVGNFSYGHPTRVTARARLGKGKVIDIQHEINMAGPLHAKAGLTIAHFLASKFNPDLPFSLSASISFEQIYGWTDGDSASIGELCALLSALADVPLNQAFAITGSCDLYGKAQAIGGVNEKIEGFFDVCKKKGLTGKQGVIIPAINQKNLMLREEVVQAVKQGKFAIYVIDSVEDAIFLLMGIPAGERDKTGNFPKGSLYNKIESRLRSFAVNKKIMGSSNK